VLYRKAPGHTKALYCCTAVLLTGCPWLRLPPAARPCGMARCPLARRRRCCCCVRPSAFTCGERCRWHVRRMHVVAAGRVPSLSDHSAEAQHCHPNTHCQAWRACGTAAVAALASCIFCPHAAVAQPHPLARTRLCAECARHLTLCSAPADSRRLCAGTAKHLTPVDAAMSRVWTRRASRCRRALIPHMRENVHPSAGCLRMRVACARRSTARPAYFFLRLLPVWGVCVRGVLAHWLPGKSFAAWCPASESLHPTSFARPLDAELPRPP
jgi:hypothetical protein